MDKFAQLLVNGLLVGLLYSLVALGFVLIRKGSGIINFAQGELILVAGYLVAWFLTDFGLPILVAVAATIGLMALLGLSVEDRKSTRLNSSHGYTSYAVFCLKKKKPR